MATLGSTAVWNRAALELGGTAPHPGDEALAALLLLHGMAMNGGIDHAVDVLSLEQFDAALNGFRFFGLSEVAELLTDVASLDEDGLARVDEAYGRLVPSDSTICEAFEAKFQLSPQLFGPLGR